MIERFLQWLFTPKYCEKCGTKVTLIQLDWFDEDTGKPAYGYRCLSHS